MPQQRLFGSAVLRVPHHHTGANHHSSNTLFVVEVQYAMGPKAKRCNHTVHQQRMFKQAVLPVPDDHACTNQPSPDMWRWPLQLWWAALASKPSEG
jgi:hypothetical protein